MHMAIPSTAALLSIGSSPAARRPAT